MVLEQIVRENIRVKTAMLTGKDSKNNRQQPVKEEAKALSSTEIMQMQRMYNKNGADIKVDGVFNRKTMEAMKKYQKQQQGRLDASNSTINTQSSYIDTLKKGRASFENKQKTMQVSDEAISDLVAIASTNSELIKNREFMNTAFGGEKKGLEMIRQGKGVTAVIQWLGNFPSDHKLSEADKGIAAQVGIRNPEKYFSYMNSKTMTIAKLLTGAGGFMRQAMADTGAKGGEGNYFSGVHASVEREKELKERTEDVAYRDKEFGLKEETLDQEKLDSSRDYDIALAQLGLTQTEIDNKKQEHAEDMRIAEKQLKQSRGLALTTLIGDTYSKVFSSLSNEDLALDAVFDVIALAKQFNPEFEATPFLDELKDEYVIGSYVSTFKTFEDFQKGIKSNKTNSEWLEFSLEDRKKYFNAIKKRFQGSLQGDQKDQYTDSVFPPDAIQPLLDKSGLRGLENVPSDKTENIANDADIDADNIFQNFK